MFCRYGAFSQLLSGNGSVGQMGACDGAVCKLIAINGSFGQREVIEGIRSEVPAPMAPSAICAPVTEPSAMCALVMEASAIFAVN